MFTNTTLADFLEKRVKVETKSKSVDYWITALRSNSVVGMHQWNNLATVIQSAMILYGLSYHAALQYCIARANNKSQS